MSKIQQNRFQPKLKIKKDDTVKVIAGKSENKGKQGRVIQVLPAKNKVIVEGINLVKKHQKPNAANPQGGIVEVEAPIHISNVAFVDADGNVTKVGRKRDEKTGEIYRFSKKTGKRIK